MTFFLSIVDEIGIAKPLIKASETVAQTQNTTASLLNMLTSLLMVLAFLLVAVFVLKKVQNASVIKSSKIKLISSLPLGKNNERLVIVKHKDKELLLGVTQDKITLLKEDDATDEALEIEKNSDNFSNILNNLSSKIKSKIENNPRIKKIKRKTALIRYIKKHKKQK